MINKYIRFSDDFFILVPVVLGGIMQDEIAGFITLKRNVKPISAGFISINEKGEVQCYGESLSLGIGVAPDDEQFFKERLMI